MKKPMEFVKAGHLGGFIKATEDWPDGDPLTFTPKLWDWALKTFAPVNTVLDVGCGEGHAVKWFAARPGVQAAYGVEGCVAGLLRTVADPKSLTLHDFTLGKVPTGKSGELVDLAWSCEFVEHVEEKYADNFLSLFALCRVVMMTHAFPKQGGHHHVNCKRPEYWVNAMTARGFAYRKELSGHSRTLEPASHWSRSGLIFEKELA